MSLNELDSQKSNKHTKRASRDFMWNSVKSIFVVQKFQNYLYYLLRNNIAPFQEPEYELYTLRFKELAI